MDPFYIWQICSNPYLNLKNACISQNVQRDCTDQTVKTSAVFIVQSPNDVTLEPENVLVDVRLDGRAPHVMKVRQELTWIDSAFLKVELIYILFY